MLTSSSQVVCVLNLVSYQKESGKGQKIVIQVKSCQKEDSIGITETKVLPSVVFTAT